MDSRFGENERSRELNTRNPLWNLFLESGSTSATMFLSVQFSQSYFHSPTPWVASSVSSSKVNQLLNSFRPGSSSYNPFLNKLDTPHQDHEQQQQQQQQQQHQVEDDYIVEEGREQDEDLDQDLHHTLNNVDPDPDDTDNPSPEVPSSSIPLNVESREITTENTPSTIAALELSPEEENRRRLYLNLGRPRPFYRTVSENDADERQEQHPNRLNKRTKWIPLLQDLARQQLIRTYGLKHLWNWVRKMGDTLPGVISDLLLTFRCQEFQEINISGERSASYNVKSVLDGKIYSAVFATSEVDKVVSNIWEEERVWLNVCLNGVQPVLGLAVDPPTQNIFYILEGECIPLKEYLQKLPSCERKCLSKKVCKSISQSLVDLFKINLTINQLEIENILINKKGDVLLENKLLMKNKPFLQSCKQTRFQVEDSEVPSFNPICCSLENKYGATLNHGNPHTEGCKNRFSNEYLDSSFETADSRNDCGQKSADEKTEAEWCLEDISFQQILPEPILTRYHKFIKNIVTSILEGKS